MSFLPTVDNTFSRANQRTLNIQLSCNGVAPTSGTPPTIAEVGDQSGTVTTCTAGQTTGISLFANDADTGEAATLQWTFEPATETRFVFSPSVGQRTLVQLAGDLATTVNERATVTAVVTDSSGATETVRFIKHYIKLKILKNSKTTNNILIIKSKNSSNNT